MKSITQKDEYGCGIACVGHVLNKNYSSTKRLFEKGLAKAKTVGFLCKDIILVLKNNGINYEYNYIDSKLKKRIYQPGSIIFIKRSKKYPSGHYLCRSKNGKWMDPWINFPSTMKSAKSGFRARLPGKPIYLIKPKNC